MASGVLTKDHCRAGLTPVERRVAWLALAESPARLPPPRDGRASPASAAAPRLVSLHVARPPRPGGVRMALETAALHRNRLRYEAGLREVFGELAPLPACVFALPFLGPGTDRWADAPPAGVPPAHAAAADRVVCVLAHVRGGLAYAPQLPALATLLLAALPEPDAFAAADALVEASLRPAGRGCDGYHVFTSAAQERACVAGCVATIAAQFPKTAGHLDRVLGGPAGTRALVGAWFRSLFVGWLPLPDALCVLDALLYEGPKVLIRVALALLKATKHALKATSTRRELVGLLRAWLAGAPLPRPLAHLGGRPSSTFSDGVARSVDSPAASFIGGGGGPAPAHRGSTGGGGDATEEAAPPGSTSPRGGGAPHEQQTMQRYCFSELRQTAFYGFPRLSLARINSAIDALPAVAAVARKTRSDPDWLYGGVPVTSTRAKGTVVRCAAPLSASVAVSRRGVHVATVALSTRTELDEASRPTVVVDAPLQPAGDATSDGEADADDAEQPPGDAPGESPDTADSPPCWFSNKVVGVGCRLLAPVCARAGGSVGGASATATWPYDAVEPPQLWAALARGEQQLAHGLWDPSAASQAASVAASRGGGSTGVGPPDGENAATVDDATDAAATLGDAPASAAASASPDEHVGGPGQGGGDDEDAEAEEGGTCTPKCARGLSRSPSPVPFASGRASPVAAAASRAPPPPSVSWALASSPFTASLATMLPHSVSHHHLAPVYSTGVHGWGLHTAYARCAGLAPLLVLVQLAGGKAAPGQRPVVGFYSSFGLPTEGGGGPAAVGAAASSVSSSSSTYSSLGGVMSVSSLRGNQGTGWIGSAHDFMLSLQPHTAFLEMAPAPPQPQHSAGGDGGDAALSQDAARRPLVGPDAPGGLLPLHKSHFILAARHMLVVGGDPARPGSAALRVSGDLHTATVSCALLRACGALPPAAQPPAPAAVALGEEQLDVLALEVYAFADRAGGLLTDGNVAAAAESKAAFARTTERYWARGHARLASGALG